MSINVLFVFLDRDRLSASDMIHVQKVMEHVYEKIVIADSVPSTPMSQNSEKTNQSQIPAEELAALAEAKIELHCNDTVSVFMLLCWVWGNTL